jgi:hypothetical protein
LRRGKDCTLLFVHPYELSVTYLESGSATRKSYTNIKGVLDKSLNGFAAKDAPLKKEKKHEAASRSSTKPSSLATSSRRKIMGLRHGTPYFI